MPVDSNTLRKAALLVASLDRHTADTLLEQMAPAEADLVRRATVALDAVDSTEQEAVISEFLGAGAVGIVGESPLSDHGAASPRSAMAEPKDAPGHEEAAHRNNDELPFHFLHDAQCEELMLFLEQEHPQTIAVVVAHLPPARAAELLGRLPDALQTEVVGRLMHMDQTDPEVLRELEQGLQSRMSARLWRSRGVDGVAILDGILAAADRTLQQQLRANLAEQAPHLARQLIRPPAELEFEELIRLDSSSLATLLTAADASLVTLALAGSSVTLAQRIRQHLPPHEARRIEESWHQMVPTNLSDMEAAQQAVVELALSLAAGGKIELPSTAHTLLA